MSGGPQVFLGATTFCLISGCRQVLPYPDLRPAWLLSNLARNSPASISNIEVASLELQRFERESKTDRCKLRATFARGCVVAAAHRQCDPARRSCGVCDGGQAADRFNSATSTHAPTIAAQSVGTIQPSWLAWSGLNMSRELKRGGGGPPRARGRSRSRAWPGGRDGSRSS